MGEPTAWKPTDYAAKLIKFKARQLVGRYGFTEGDRRGIEQKLLFRLWQGSSSYTPGRGHIDAFTKAVIQNAVATLVEHQRAIKRGRQEYHQSLNDEVEGDGKRPIERGDLLDQDTAQRRLGRTPRHFTDEADLKMAIEEALKPLPAEAKALAEQLGLFNPTEISRNTGIPRSTICDRVAKLRKSFLEAGLEEFL